MKLNLGAGNDIRNGYVNHDIIQLEGIQIVHDLNICPWPWDDNAVDYILSIDVIEHLDDFTKTMEEIFRILKPDGIIELKVPYWNSYCAYADPQHKKFFHELTFRFFDVESPYYKERKYYTNAKFIILKESFIIAPFNPYFRIPFIGERIISGKYSKKILGLIGNLFSNIILGLHITMIKQP